MKSVDHGRRDGVLQFMANHSELLARQGSVQETWRGSNGPYFALAFRQAGRQRRFYLGSDKDLANEVQRKLHAIQRPRIKQVQYRQQHQGLRAELARWKAAWAEELSRIGLRLKGYETRGWREVKSYTKDIKEENHASAKDGIS